METMMDPETKSTSDVSEASESPTPPQEPKRKRGRPRKIKPAQEEGSTPEADSAPLPAPPPPPPPAPAVPDVVKATGRVRARKAKVSQEATVQVWLGTAEACPFSTVYAGGQDFPRFSQTLHTEEVNKTRRETHIGKLVDLTPSEIERISIAVGRKIIRHHGAQTNIMNVDGKSFREMGGDEPLGAYLYMIVMKDSLPHNWRDLTPETMA
jgi:hypothetical protein